MSRNFCIVPKCREPGRHHITLRCRRPDTSAVWAPTTGAHLCDRHATEGLEVDIVVRPKKNRKVKVTTVAENRGEVSLPSVRQVDIIQGANRAPSG
jgi:hypothetical protein